MNPGKRMQMLDDKKRRLSEKKDEYKQLIDAPKPKPTRKPRSKTTDDPSSTTETV